MSILWHEKITEEIQEDANLSLASFGLSIGEKNALAEEYGVSLRTCERWFAGEGMERRNCMPNAAVGKRLIFMQFDSRLESIRKRCLLPGLYSVPGGIERDSGKTGVTKETLILRPTLATIIQVAELVIDGTSDGGPFLRRCWERMYTVYLGWGEGRNWGLYVEYRRPVDHDELYDEGPTPEPDEEEDNGNEYDEVSGQEYVWNPM